MSHGLSVRIRLSWFKVHKFCDGKPLCGQVGARDGPEATWIGLPELRCKKCLCMWQEAQKEVENDKPK